MGKRDKTRVKAKNTRRKKSRNFGGRATAVGVGYENRVAAFIAVNMLAGQHHVIWDGIFGRDIAEIVMQDDESVDDIVISLHGGESRKIYISAKHRNASVALSSNSSVFVDVILSFVQQFLSLSSTARKGCRLLWVVPSTVGAPMKHDLRGVLNSYRRDGSSSIASFIKRRNSRERRALEIFWDETKRIWTTETGNEPTNRDLNQFLLVTHVEVLDFGFGFQHELRAQEIIGKELTERRNDSGAIWEKLESFFSKQNESGLAATSRSIRKMLSDANFKLEPAEAFVDDIERLRELTNRNVETLRDHSSLKFGDREVRVPRLKELNRLITWVRTKHLLLTGGPGCGKSGLLWSLVKYLEDSGTPVVVILAERLYGTAWSNDETLPGLSSSLDRVLNHWPDGKEGVIVTDALDSLRDPQSQFRVRSLLQSVVRGNAGWTVVASVREFDLKCSAQLRDVFPGEGVAGNECKSFEGVAHFYLSDLQECEVDALTEEVPSIGPFIESARKNQGTERIHRSPFFLRLAAELLGLGELPKRLSDWRSPAPLLRKYWEKRVLGGKGANLRKVTLRAICDRMKNLRRVSVCEQELSLSERDFDAVDELRSRGVLQSPDLRRGCMVGADEFRFSHHLLHDYAIARTLIPTAPDAFVAFSAREPLMAIFYRQSFIFVFEGLWERSKDRADFWEAALAIESARQLHIITRILAPDVAAARVSVIQDFEVFLKEIRNSPKSEAATLNVLRHLVFGLEDTDEDRIQAGIGAWIRFAAELSELLPSRANLESPVVRILSKLTSIDAGLTDDDSYQFNRAARGALSFYTEKPVGEGWKLNVKVSVEVICRTYSIAPDESEASLKAILRPERLAEVPHWDLFSLSLTIAFLPLGAEEIILQIFSAAFSFMPETGEWENLGGAIMSMSFQTSDNWRSVRHNLVDYFDSQSIDNEALVTAIACSVWNACVRERSELVKGDEVVIGKVRLCGHEGVLVGDYGHVWKRGHDQDMNRVFVRFEEYLDNWASAGSRKVLSDAIEQLVTRNRTSDLWRVFMKMGAKHPKSLGVLLLPVLENPIVLIHADYSNGGALLYSAMHHASENCVKQRLEEIALSLVESTRSCGFVPDKFTVESVKHIVGKLLRSLPESSIVLAAAQVLRARVVNDSSSADESEGEIVSVYSPASVGRVAQWRRESLPKDIRSESLMALRDELCPLAPRDNTEVDQTAPETTWKMVLKSDRAIRRYREDHPKPCRELWGDLVQACWNIVRVSTWAREDKRWRVLRRIFLDASLDPAPPKAPSKYDEEDSAPSWGYPAPRLDAARGMLLLAFRMGEVNSAMNSALLKLRTDKCMAVRFNMGDRLHFLEGVAPELMWNLIDRFVRYERRFCVLEMVVVSLIRLWSKFEKKVMESLLRISRRAERDADDKHPIHRSLANAFLSHFVFSGNKGCEAQVNLLIADCDRPRAKMALRPQLHQCRKSDLLTHQSKSTGNRHCDDSCERTWLFCSRLLDSSVEKLRYHRARLIGLAAEDPSRIELEKLITEGIDCTSELVHDVAMQLYFASGAHDEKSSNGNDSGCDVLAKERFWKRSERMFRLLSEEIHPSTAHQVIATLRFLLPGNPREIFLTACNAVQSSSKAGFQYESLAEGEVVKLVESVLADYQHILEEPSEPSKETDCMLALLDVLDVFVDAGWPGARQMTRQLAEVYR